MKHVYINEYLKNDRLSGFYILKSASVKQTKSGNDYLDGSISDKSGELRIKVWGYNENDLSLTVGGIVFVSGNVAEYAGALQATLATIRNASVNEVDDMEALLPSAPEPVVTMLKYFADTIEKYVHDQKLTNLLYKALGENKEALMTLPAAKMVHHDVIGGLVLHVREMLILGRHVVEAAEEILAAYNEIAVKDGKKEFHVDSELLMTGIIMHDMRKIREFTQGPLGLVTDYSVEGNLLGHIYMGAEYIHDLCKEFDVDAETEMLLKSMILSHHGKPEYGSAIVPQFLEAYLLHEIDDIDARLYLFREQFNATAPGELAPRHFALDGARAYHMVRSGEDHE